MPQSNAQTLLRSERETLVKNQSELSQKVAQARKQLAQWEAEIKTANISIKEIDTALKAFKGRAPKGTSTEKSGVAAAAPKAGKKRGPKKGAKKAAAAAATAAAEAPAPKTGKKRGPNKKAAAAPVVTKAAKAPKAAKAAKATKAKVAKAPKAAKAAKVAKATAGSSDKMPPFKERLQTILGTSHMTIPQIIDELKARKWTPQSKKLNIYVSFMLSSSKEDFERVERGVYRNKVGKGKKATAAASTGIAKTKVAASKVNGKATKKDAKKGPSDSEVESGIADLGANDGNVSANPFS